MYHTDVIHSLKGYTPHCAGQMHRYTVSVRQEIQQITPPELHHDLTLAMLLISVMMIIISVTVLPVPVMTAAHVI